VTQRREVVVVGGGQAGLAIGYYLAQRTRDFAIVEAAAEPSTLATSSFRWSSTAGCGRYGGRVRVTRLNSMTGATRQSRW
jgi:cation diffusion facilitator CzcD-associated flavoprotein CzcO